MRGEVRGANELSTKLKQLSDRQVHVDLINAYGTKLTRLAKREAVFRGHYEGKKFVKPTGNLKRNIMGEMIGSGDSLTYVCRVPVERVDYAYYVEHGTRYMSAQPYMKPAFDTIKGDFKKALHELF